jgi:hypothetical protein
LYKWQLLAHFVGNVILSGTSAAGCAPSLLLLLLMPL